MSACDRSVALLDGYHDGELGWLARWRVGRHLKHCSGCSGELRRLEQVGDWVRRSEPSPEAPDLWAHLQRRLPELDREIGTVTATVPPRLPRFVLPVGAGVAVASVALALALLWPRPASTGTGVVRSLYSPTQPVMVLEDSEESTIIWVLDTPADQRSGEVIHALG